MRRTRTTKTLVIDGNVLLKRSYNGAKNLYYKETHIGGLYQFYTIIRKLVVEFKINKIVVMWDGARGGSLRLDYYPEYKGNRPKFFDESYERQKLRIQQYAEELSIRQYEHEECESDDLMAFYTQNRKKNEDVMIYTNDRDLCQLISENISIYLADKKMEVGIGNYGWFFKHYYKNAGLVKILEGCSSDYIKGISGVTERTLLEHFPEIGLKEVTLSEIIDRSKIINEERERPLKVLNNIIEGNSKGCHRGDFYEINNKIINLNEPLLTDEAKEEVLILINDPIDPEGRETKNVLKMMIEDGIIFVIPGGQDGYIKYMEPFVKLSKKEKQQFRKSKK